MQASALRCRVRSGVSIPSLNLDAFSILKLSCLILSAIIAIHLYSIPRRTLGSLFGAMALTGCSLFCFAMLLEFAGEHYWQPRHPASAIVPYLQNLGPLIALTSLILLAFHAVVFLRKHIRIARVAVAISIGLNVVSFALCIYNFAYLRPRSDFSFQDTYFLITYLFLAIQFLFVIFIFLQKASLLSSAKLTWSWRALFKPQNMRARYARTYGLVFVLLAAGHLGFRRLTMVLAAGRGKLRRMGDGLRFPCSVRDDIPELDS